MGDKTSYTWLMNDGMYLQGSSNPPGQKHTQMLGVDKVIYQYLQ
jgi:hypothetical protein